MTNLWRNNEAQDIAEYALMLAILLAIVVAVLQAIGGGANGLLSAVASKLGAAI